VATALAQAGEDLWHLAALIAEENRAGLREFLERGVAFRRSIDAIPGSQRSSQS
jgi:hypothetical protein